MCELIKQNLLGTQQRMKHQADKHWQESQFEVGDWVYFASLYATINGAQGESETELQNLWALPDSSESGRRRL